MNTILIKKIKLNNSDKDILISGNRFERIADEISIAADIEIDGSGMAIIPPFYNGHCHSAMTLLRGYADDMLLDKWLNEYIWPFEAKMSAADIYAGSRLAILEMIKSGTVFFCDMYWDEEQTIRAAEEMDVRASIGVSMMDRLDHKTLKRNFEFLAEEHNYSSRISLNVAPHAIYTVGKELLCKCRDAAEKNNLTLSMHLAETQKEIDDCLAENNTTPVRYLEKLGLLGENSVFAHVVHVDEDEAEILAKTKSVIVHNPASNMKLSSGVLKMSLLQEKGCRVMLGTDGTSSNNNLCMLDEMKLAALLAKVSDRPDLASADEIFEMATAKGAAYFNINAGKIEEGKLADALLINLKNERLVPNYNLISNLVYSADCSCIDTVICDGQIIMQNHKVKGEGEIIDEAIKVCEKLTKA